MEQKSKIAVILTLAMTFCFVLVSLAQAEEEAKPLMCMEHKPNPRFAILDPCSPEEEGDDLVLDKKTGLVWARNAHLAGEALTWEDACIYCQNLTLGNRKGWRLPTKEELLSLVDPSRTYPALAKGHPFINVKYTYWTGTTHEDLSVDAYYVHL
nr:DUF1566 domain-containing protein [Pseudomonadota bacterium]